ncbi:hypothetical protein BAE44_0020355 [Dichanthelium oligosanthes]|uniref:Uncharacterized protein n=1 Tax=Dichanthelium oligosanthes TaxID=888268 RepID=A0A1E5V0F6_9POAL|nr:hypothetical protein BAE44_0020355 [Dichanthelium oligosanthes]
MADPATMNEPEIVEEDVAVAAEFAPCTTTVGRINSLLWTGRVAEYFRAKMTDSNKGWHSEWFYVANPPLPLPKFSGRFTEKVDEWEWVTSDDEKKVWVRPMLALLKPLKDAGLTGVKVRWTFFERRVQPLAARAHPLFRYTSADDPTRASQGVLAPGEVRSRVWAVIKQAKNTEDDIAELDCHKAGLAPEPAARCEGHDPVIISLLSFRVYCSSRPLW